MRTCWTWLQTRRTREAVRWEAEIRATVDQCEARITRGTVAHIQARLRRAAAADRLTDAAAALLHDPVDDLSAELLRTRRRQSTATERIPAEGSAGDPHAAGR